MKKQMNIVRAKRRLRSLLRTLSAGHSHIERELEIVQKGAALQAIYETRMRAIPEAERVGAEEFFAEMGRLFPLGDHGGVTLHDMVETVYRSLALK